ncbi:MAG: carboxypeptidase-like regulatory domain-containing protein, partial [Tangfeifania sp.]
MSIIRKNLKLFLFLVALLTFTHSYSQQKTLTGEVTDAATGEPLPGVTIVVQGTARGTITDVDGQYS